MKRAVVVAGTLAAVTFACVIAWTAMFVADATGGRLYEYWAEAIIVVVAFPSLALLILRHRPDNRIGWLFLLIGATAGPELLAGQLAIVIRPGPAAAVLWIVAEMLRLGSFFSLGFLVLLYPTGRLPGRRWHLVAWALALGIAMQIASIVLMPGSIEGLPGVESPMPSGLELAASILAQGAALVVVPALIAAAASMIVRYVRAGTIEREQIKLFAFAPTIIAVVIIATSILLPEQMEGPLGSVVWGSPVVLLPGFAAFAIIRRGLFDIDRIISRTLSYAVMTAFLGGTFVIVVLVPTAVAGAAGQTPDWVIAVATLAVAALFRPARTRVQSAIDRRFNRRRYDAQHTVDTFALRLRQQIDIDALGAELGDVVSRTMQPSRVSVWIRERR